MGTTASAGGSLGPGRVVTGVVNTNGRDTGKVTAGVQKLLQRAHAQLKPLPASLAGGKWQKAVGVLTSANGESAQYLKLVDGKNGARELWQIEAGYQQGPKAGMFERGAKIADVKYPVMAPRNFFDHPHEPLEDNRLTYTGLQLVELSEHPTQVNPGLILSTDNHGVPGANFAIIPVEVKKNNHGFPSHAKLVKQCKDLIVQFGVDHPKQKPLSPTGPTAQKVLRAFHDNTATLKFPLEAQQGMDAPTLYGVAIGLDLYKVAIGGAIPGMAQVYPAGHMPLFAQEG